MRSYVIYSFARLAVDETGDGPLVAMFVRIGFGTAPLTSVELFPVVPGVWSIFVDPFDGRRRDDYNDAVEFVRPKVPAESRVIFIVGVVPERLVGQSVERTQVETLAPLHLDTGSMNSEIATQYHSEDRLLPGGSVVWDTYRWTTAEKEREIDNLLRPIRVNSFVLPTGQLVFTKVWHSRDAMEASAEKAS